MAGFEGVELGQSADQGVPAKGDVPQGFVTFQRTQVSGAGGACELRGRAAVGKCFRMAHVDHVLLGSNRRRAKARARKPDRAARAA